MVAPIKESEEESYVNALQLRDLSKQIAKLSDELACLEQQNSFRGYAPRRVWQQKYRDAPICWNCGKKGHLKRMCPASIQGKSSRKSSSPVYPTLNMVSRSATITVQGFLFNIPVRMLVDTGSAVIIVSESVWKKTDREPTIVKKHRPLQLSQLMGTLCHLSFQHMYMLVPKQEFMECQNQAVAHSIYTVQPQQTTITVRVLNPPLEATTVHLNQKIGQLNPLSHVSEVCYLQPQKS